MHQQVIYELYTASARAKTWDNQASLDKTNTSIAEILGIKSSKNQLSIDEIPKNPKKNLAVKILFKTIDRIIQMNSGVSVTKTLGYHYYISYKLLFAAEVLNFMLFLRAARLAAEQAAKIAEKYHFLNVAFPAHRIIYSVNNYTNNFQGEMTGIKKFNYYLKCYQVEKNIEIDRNKLFHHLNNTTSFDDKLIKLCGEAISKYQEYENIIPSFYFHNHYYYINYVFFTSQNMHDEAFAIAQKALLYFESLSFSYVPGKLLYTYILIVYCTQRKEFEKGLQLIEGAQKIVNTRSQHLYRLKENELLIYLHKGDFESAVNLFFKAYNSSTILSILPLDKQRWMLYEAYINLILETENVLFENKRKRFSIQKFINELPRFSKDKRSMNIPILIAQMLFFIVRKQYNRAIDRIEALDKYTSRYLRNNETFRSNCFIKMLLEIPKNSFNRLRVERAAQKYFERLLDSEVELINQPFEIEIIPYERLWAMIMNHLRPDHHYTPKTPRIPVHS